MTAFWEYWERVFGYVRAFFMLRGCRKGAFICSTGHVQLRNKGNMSLGRRVTLVGGMIPSQFVCEEGAILQVGEHSIFNYGAMIHASKHVQIGARCMFASFVELIDKDEAGNVLPIILEDDVWLAHGAVIKPGVRIGQGSVVSAGSVVVQDVPPHSLAIGSPARCMPLEMRG